MNAGHEIEPFRFVKAARRLLRPITTYLEDLAKDERSEELQAEAFLALGKIGDAASLDCLQTAFDTYPDRIEPIAALGFFRNASPVPRLLKRLENPDVPYKEEIVRVLGEIGDPMAGKMLMELLRDQDRMVRYFAAWALYKIGGREVVPSLCRLLSDPDEWIVINVLEILSRMREVDAIPALVGQFEIARDPRLKSILISSLATFAEPQLLKVFEEGLKSFDPRIQANSVEAISLMKIPALEMKRKLKRFYSHPNNRVRANTILALWKSDEEKVRQEIEAMIGGPDVPTRRSAAYVLSKAQLAGRDGLIDRLLADSAYGVRKMALKAALALDTSVGINRILPLFKDQNVWVRKEAVDCARKIDDFPREPVLELFKGEKSPPVLESLLDFLVERHMDQAVDMILGKIREEPEEGMPKLLYTLGHLNAREALVKARKSLGPASAEVLREFYISMLLHGELPVFVELANTFKEKTRDEDQLILVKVAGELGTFVQNTEAYSRKLIEALSAEVGKDMEGVSGFQAPPPPPELKPESIKTGIDLFTQGKLDEAREFFQRYLAAFPGNPEALYHAAAIPFKQNDPEKALPMLMQLMEKSPGHVAGGLLLGQIHFQKKKWDELMKLYESLRGRIPTEDKKSMGQVQGALGLAYFHLKRYQKAIETLNLALEANPRDLSSCYHLALCYYAIKEHRQALKLLYGLRKSLPPDSRVLKNVEELLQKLEDEA